MIAVNSSWPRVPFAEFLFFGDQRWWNQYHEDLLNSKFAGRLVTCSPLEHPRVLRLQKINAIGLSDQPNAVMMTRTSLAAAISFAVHLGVLGIILIGADGRAADNGQTHHHARHPWDQKYACWDEMRPSLAAMVKPLRDRGITVRNASPGSAWADLWPVVTLSEALGECL